MERGAIDFDFAEAKIIVNEQGEPTEIRKRERSVAEKLIEEFMLAANETVAEHFYWLRVPFLYRVHEDPDSEKLLHFAEFAATLGHPLRGAARHTGKNKTSGESGKNGRSSKSGKSSKNEEVNIHPKSLQKLLEEIKGTAEENVISTVMLRSMKQARYAPDSLGHFGLAAEFYSHFTSPIRRYPDLVIHRVMREVLASGGTLSEVRLEYLNSRMGEIATQSSDRERLAVDAERETDQLKKTEFMLRHVGEEFDGVISSVTSFGMFIELENTVEGLIRLSDMDDDFYHHHADQHALIGERTSRIFRLGDRVRIKVARANVTERTIDFVIAGAGAKKALRNKDGRTKVQEALGRRGAKGMDRGGRVGGGGRSRGKSETSGSGRQDGRGSGRNESRNSHSDERDLAPVESAAELATVDRDHADFVPAPRKKKKPNIWEIIERKKQTTNAKQKKARDKDASYKQTDRQTKKKKK
jgi:ribonuclease R